MNRSIIHFQRSLLALAFLAAQIASTVPAHAGFAPTRTHIVDVTLRAPLTTDDSSAGYFVGNLWNVPGLGMWICNDNTLKHAIWSPLPTGILPLDSVPGVTLHGWATRQLRYGYTGSPLQVTIGSTPTDVPFDSRGNLDIPTLATDIGAVPAVSLTSSPQMWSIGVTKWYDQTSGTALPATVPSGDQAPQISPLYTTNGSPFVGFASGGMNWLTDYQSTQNIQNEVLQTGAYSVDANNTTIMMVGRSGPHGAFNTPISFSAPNGSYPINIAFTDANITSPIYEPAGILNGLDYGFGFQIPSSPSVFGINLGSTVATAFDDDNGSFVNNIAVTTGSIPISSATLTPASMAGIAVGQYIVMAGIPAGAIVTQVNATNVYISQVSTAAETNVPVNFTAPLIGNGGSWPITFGALSATATGFAVSLSAVIVGPSLTPAQSLALRESMTDTFQLTPQVRNHLIVSGDSVGAGADGWETQMPIRHAEAVLDRHYVIYNTSIAGSQIDGTTAPAQTFVFPTLVQPLYTPYALNVLYEQGGINSLANNASPSATLTAWQKWIGMARGLGPNVRLVGQTMEPHIAVAPDSLRTSYNALLASNFNLVDGVADIASSPILGNPSIISDRTYTVYNGGHHSPYYQSMEGILMGAAINAAAQTSSP